LIDVALSPDFESPVARAKLNLLLRFAAVTRQHLVFAYEQLPNTYVTFLRVLADEVTKAIATQGPPSTAEQVWDGVKHAQPIQKLPKTAISPVLQAFELALLSAAIPDDSALSYLHEANERAVAWIHELATHLASQPSVAVLAKLKLRGLQVVYDPGIKNACATSSRSGPMSWSMQPSAFAFFGAIFAELMFVHEYICHLIPANRQLDNAVREVWLNSCILFGVRNLPSLSRERQATKVIWQLFRNEYVKHFDIAQYDVDGPLSLEDLTHTLCGKELFWTVTLAILSTPDGPEEAKVISYLFNYLASLTDGQLGNIDGVPWDELRTLRWG
jgi:hypothetical protein